MAGQEQKSPKDERNDRQKKEERYQRRAQDIGMGDIWPEEFQENESPVNYGFCI